MKLIRVIKKSYVQKKKIKEAMNKAIDYYGKSRNGTAKLWGALYEDGSVGKRIYDAITDYVHGLSNRCGYCQDRIFHNSNSNVDHILPASIYPQFTFVEENLVRVCTTCNMLKSAHDFYSLPVPVGNGYRQHSRTWTCYHPRHQTYSQHVDRLVVQTNHLHFRAYIGKTPQGKQLCTLLLQQVSEFEVKATANPVVALAAQKLSNFVQSRGNVHSDAVKKLLQTLVKNT
ncbi:HNH endonuclease [Aeromonas dhakensis]|uniref:HNH endonuclease n=1 Tax=Aeromonas dhakensis TaxID=196024 RepID=UPI003B9E4049